MTAPFAELVLTSALRSASKQDKMKQHSKEHCLISLTSANKEKRKDKKKAKQFYFVIITMSSNNRILQTLFNPIIVFESPTMVGVSTFYKHLE